MYHKAADLQHVFNENMRGGTGTVEIIHSVQEGDYESKLKMVARLVLTPGTSLGEHSHEGEEEIITILSGTANYNDNGEMVTLHAGDTCVCLSGQSHSIANADENETLVIMAVISYLS